MSPCCQSRAHSGTPRLLVTGDMTWLRVTMGALLSRARDIAVLQEVPTPSRLRPSGVSRSC
jgi:hypothetical protein